MVQNRRPAKNALGTKEGDIGQQAQLLLVLIVLGRGKRRTKHRLYGIVFDGLRPCCLQLSVVAHTPCVTVSGGHRTTPRGSRFTGIPVDPVQGCGVEDRQRGHPDGPGMHALAAPTNRHPGTQLLEAFIVINDPEKAPVDLASAPGVDGGGGPDLLLVSPSAEGRDGHREWPRGLRQRCRTAARFMAPRVDGRTGS